nr:L-lactate dehydrogenase [Candidatus Gracilibacteria bacterium]
MEREFPNSFKISVIGCGSVGATTAYSLLLGGVPTHLTLIDVRKEQAEGLDLDLEHSIPFTSYCRIKNSDNVKDCKGSDL